MWLKGSHIDFRKYTIIGIYLQKGIQALGIENMIVMFLGEKLTV